MQTKDCLVTFRNYGLYHLPPGLRVKPVGDGEFFLDEFPEWLFRKDSIQLHDATYYGLRLKADQVKEDS